jgi:hypothetical protein
MQKYSNKIKLVLDCDVLDKTTDDFEVLDYYPQLKLIRTGEYYAEKYQDYYFCYNYAFKTIHLDEVEEAFRILIHDYIPVEKKNARQGDIISFHSIRQNDGRIFKTPNDLNCNHFAVISGVQDGKINIKSKFGILGVFEGTIYDLPESYGNNFCIWRKQNKKSSTEKNKSVKNETVSF